HRPYRRPFAIAAALVLLMSASPVSADDPIGSPPPSPAEATDGVVEQPTIHAEMLAAEAGASYSFEPGAEPESLAGAGSSVQGEDGTGGIAALPNGLSHEIFGYLPYWALSSSLRQYLRYDLVTSIAYFGVPVNTD